MNCKHCGTVMKELTRSNTVIDGRPVTRREWYCPGCWGGYTESTTDSGTLADTYWYDPGENAHLKDELEEE